MDSRFRGNHEDPRGVAERGQIEDGASPGHGGVRESRLPGVPRPLE